MDTKGKLWTNVELCYKGGLEALIYLYYIISIVRSLKGIYIFVKLGNVINI